MTGNGHNTQEELASYAMQSLPVEESASIRTHLQSCASCRTELAEVCGDLALLGIAVEQHPLPEGARERFLNRIAASPAVKPQETVTEPTPISVTRSRRGPGFWIPWVTAAAMAIAAVSLAVQNRALNDELEDESSLVTNLAGQASRAQQVLEVLTAPSAQRVTLTEGNAPAEPSARATYLPERGASDPVGHQPEASARRQGLRALGDPCEWQGACTRRSLSPRCNRHRNPGATAAVAGHPGQSVWGNDRESQWLRCSNLSDRSLRSGHRKLVSRP